MVINEQLRTKKLIQSQEGIWVEHGCFSLEKCDSALVDPLSMLIIRSIRGMILLRIRLLTET